jgi:hypothetical protein
MRHLHVQDDNMRRKGEMESPYEYACPGSIVTSSVIHFPTISGDTGSLLYSVANSPLRHTGLTLLPRLL